MTNVLFFLHSFPSGTAASRKTPASQTWCYTVALTSWMCSESCASTHIQYMCTDADTLARTCLMRAILSLEVSSAAGKVGPPGPSVASRGSRPKARPTWWRRDAGSFWCWRGWRTRGRTPTEPTSTSRPPPTCSSPAWWSR